MQWFQLRPVRAVPISRSLCHRTTRTYDALFFFLHSELTHSSREFPLSFALHRRARCTDNELYDEPPCTDYVDFTPYPGRWIGAPLPMPTNISSSPGELFETAAGLPLLLTLAVLILHATCYAAQLLCGGREDTEPEDFLSPRDAMNATIARGGLRADQAPLLPSKSA